MAFFFQYERGYLLLKSDLMEATGAARHGFSTRVSRGGADVDLRIRREDPASGLGARRAFFGACLAGCTEPAMVHQVHGTLCWMVRRAEDLLELEDSRGGRVPGMARPDGDAMVTADSRVPALVQTADCLPVLLWDPEHGAAAAIHSGWKGTFARIARHTANRMGEKYGTRPQALLAAVGPGIGPCCYEVDEALAEKFEQEFPGAAHRTGAGRPTLNLRACIAADLAELGVSNDCIETTELCTRCNRGLFHSYRRDGAGAGRMISWINGLG